MHLTNDASRGQLVSYTFGQDALAAGQSDVQLPVAAGEASQAVDSVVAPWAGSIVGIGWVLSAAGSAGTLSIGCTVDGTENASTTQAITTAAEGYASFGRSLARVVPGSNIGAEITTDGSWNGTSSDLTVQVYVLYELAGV